MSTTILRSRSTTGRCGAPSPGGRLLCTRRPHGARGHVWDAGDVADRHDDDLADEASGVPAVMAA